MGRERERDVYTRDMRVTGVINMCRGGVRWVREGLPCSVGCIHSLGKAGEPPSGGWGKPLGRLLFTWEPSTLHLHQFTNDLATVT